MLNANMQLSHFFVRSDLSKSSFKAIESSKQVLSPCIVLTLVLLIREILVLLILTMFHVYTYITIIDRIADSSEFHYVVIL